MKIPYRILWIDDQIKDEEDRTKKIVNYLSELGFSPEIDEIEDVEEFEQKESLIDLVKRKNFDLILTDFNFGEDEDMNGRYVVNKLRDGEILTEILFYTSRPNLIEVVKPLYFGEDENAEIFQPVQRISFHPGQAGLVDKIKEIIELQVAKFQEIRAFRGFVLAETADLDALIEKVGNKLVEKLDNTVLREKFQNNLKGTVQYLEKTNDKFDRFFEGEDYNGYLQQTNASNKYTLVKELLKTVDIDASLPGFNLGLFKKYIDVIEERNCFAHDCIVEEEGLFYLEKTTNGKRTEFNQETCIELRKKIKDHSLNIQLLAKILGVEFT